MSEFREKDKGYMRMALELGKRGNGYVNPNPLVGAVIVNGGEVVGQGYHSQYGALHAEAEALADAGEEAEGATMYVTLEPCTHHGKTPPCSETIVEAGIEEVYIGTRDPNPRVSGGGAGRLEEAGLDVHLGLLEEEARKQNEIFLHYVQTNRPFVLLKLAMTSDGKIATRTGDSRWITSEEARRRVHRLRARYSGIVVGKSTLLSDDPRLTARDADGPDGARFIFTSDLDVPLDLNAFNLNSNAPTILVTGREASGSRVNAFKEEGVGVWRFPDLRGSVDPGPFLERCGREGYDSLLVEGGGEIAWSFLSGGSVDKVSFFYAPKVVGGRDAVPGVGGTGVEGMQDAIDLEDVTIERYGPDLCLTGYPKYG